MSSTTICMTDTSVIPFPTLDSAYAQPSTTGPLPLTPSRNARLSSSLSFSDLSVSDPTSSEPSDTADFALQSRSVTYVRYDSESSSSSSTPSDDIRPTIIPRSKRVASQHSISPDSRDIFNSLTPASTPVKQKADGRSFTGLEIKKQTPLLDPSDDEATLRPFPLLKPFCKVGRLRLEGSAANHTRHASDSNVIPSRVAVAGTPSANQPPQIIRKKSGQPIKSSLKSARRPELHVVTNGSLAKSEPATPTKAVHFDSKLEHVKLFLAEQKPLAVSRDGSPTSDTSGDEFPSFIYGNGNSENKRVKMLLPNMPSSPRNREVVALQELVLSQDQRTITGNVRVRNIAYEKWLAIRFTLDWWQTTSEVTARYEKSIEDGAFDIFTFSIRLHDIWSRIEEKAIFIALRYTVAGEEYWDNNAGQNYHIKFVLAPPTEPSSAVDNEASLKVLDTRLEGLAQARSSPIPITPYRLARSFSADHQYSSFAKPLSTRFDFASANKTKLTNYAPPLSNQHMRTKTHPSGVPATAGPTVAPWTKASTSDQQEKVTSPPHPETLGSPRQVMDGTPPLSTRPEAKSTSPESPSPTGRDRNHRRAFIDRVVEGSPNLRKTPPGSPLKFDVTGSDTAAHLPRIRSFPLSAERSMSVGSLQAPTPKPPLSITIMRVDDGDSEESTPYEALQSSSSSNSSCTPLFSPVSDGPQSGTSYKQFLDQFCFYTGTDSSQQESSETIPRSFSTSSIDRFLLSHSPPPSFHSQHDAPVRFPFDSSSPPMSTALHA